MWALGKVHISQQAAQEEQVYRPKQLESLKYMVHAVWGFVLS